MQVINTGWKKYRLDSFTGRVTGMGKDFVMYTFGQNTIGAVHGKGKRWIPVSVETSTKSFNHIFLTGNDGTEHSFYLENFDIACREGHELTAIWAVKPGEERGPCIIVLNNTTKQAFFSGLEIAKMFNAPSLIYILIITGSFINVYFLFHNTIVAVSVILPGFFIVRFISLKISRAAAKKFIAGFRLV
jgi:hypothetical protein